MKQTLIILLIAWSTGSTQKVAQSNTECDFPSGDKGNCVPIENCKRIQELSSQQNNPVAEKVLKRLICDRKPGRDVKVCCPKSDGEDIMNLMNQRPSKTTPPPEIISFPTPKFTTAPSMIRTTKKPLWTTFRPNIEVPKIDLEITPTGNWNNSVLPKPKECGKPNPHQYSVVGRKHAAYGSWPWMAALGYESKMGPEYVVYLYAGSLITERHVLTAARVVCDKKVVTARFGVLDLNQFNPSRIDVPVKSTLVHEHFNPSNLLNDIAIIELEQTIKYSDLIRPICLPHTHERNTKTYENTKYLRVAGWGSTNPTEASLLKEAIIPVVSEEDCRRVYKAVDDSYIDSKVICAGYLDGGVDACRGDFGGPLMDKDNPQEVYLVGILSYSGRCVLPGFPGVFTRVSSYMDWIMRNVENPLLTKKG